MHYVILIDPCTILQQFTALKAKKVYSSYTNVLDQVMLGCFKIEAL